MTKPIIYYDNTLRSAQQGDDGTTYATAADCVRHPVSDFGLLSSLALSADLGGDYTKLIGLTVRMDSTLNPYLITAQSSIGTDNLPQSVGWTDSAWNGTVFCAVGFPITPATTDKCATSPDGIVWTERTLPAARYWTAISWNGSVFCAVAQASDKGAVSADGISWTEVTLPASRNWNAIAWNGLVFCAVADGPTDKCATSPDGTAWTEQTMVATARDWSDIAWNGTVFCAISGTIGSTTDKCATSPDGITWTERTMATDQEWYALSWNGSVFCAVAIGDALDAATDKCNTSPDGTTWTERTMDSAQYWGDIAWNGSTFLASDISVPCTICTSPDGTTWTDRTAPSTPAKYCIATNGSYFIMIDYDSNDCYLSYDGIYWPTRSITLFERLQTADIGDSFTIKAGLTCAQQDTTRVAAYAADNALSPVFKGQENTALYLRAHLPNIIKDGSFESGAFSPNWTAGANWVHDAANVQTAANGRTLTQGAETATYAKTAAHDLDYYQITEDVTNGIDMELLFTVADAANAKKVTVHGRYEGNASHYVEVHAWNYIGADWDVISTSTNRIDHSTIDYTRDFMLTADHRDAGTGNLRIRFLHSSAPPPYSASHNLYLDQVLIQKENVVEGVHSACWDTAADNNLVQSCTEKLKKGKTYRFLVKTQALTGNAAAGCLTIQFKQVTSETDLYSAITGNTIAPQTVKGWTAFDVVPDFDTDNWELRIVPALANKGDATMICVDEIYYYEKPAVTTLNLGRHNLVGKSITVTAWRLSPLRSTAPDDASNSVVIGSLTVGTADTYSSALTASDYPVYEIYIPAVSSFTPEIGELYIGGSYQFSHYPQAPLDPYRTNAEGLRDITLQFNILAPALRTTTIADLFTKLRANESVWLKWESDPPLLMHSPQDAREAAYNPYRVGLTLRLVEIV